LNFFQRCEQALLQRAEFNIAWLRRADLKALPLCPT